jgi:hypothetical protein
MTIKNNNGNYDFVENELENIFNRIYFETNNNIIIKNNKQKELFVI